MNITIKTGLIIEPNKLLQQPYSYIQKSLSVQRVESIQVGMLEISKSKPDIVFLSTSFSISQTVELLTALKNKSQDGLIPLIFVIDLSQKISSVPGTTWGNKLGILCSQSSFNELNSTLDRVFQI